MSDNTMGADGMLIAPPTIPRAPRTQEPAPPAPAEESYESKPRVPETLGELLIPAARQFTRTLPKMLPRLALFAVVIIAVNAILMPLQLWRMPQALASFLQVVIFLTAAYSAIIPKTFFWMLIFAGGRHILRQARSSGVSSVFKQFSRGCTATIELVTSGLQDSQALLVAGSGLGMLGTIYLSGTTPGRSAPTLLAIVGIVYVLGADSSILLSVIHLGARDIMRFLKQDARLEMKRVRRFLAASLAGVPLAFLFMLISSTAGYVVGTLVILGGAVLSFARPAPDAS